MGDIRASFRIFFTLFRNSLIWSVFLIFISFVIVTTIPIIVNSYNKSLENSLATKQPHIMLEYINEHKVLTPNELKNLEQQIKDLLTKKNFKEINPYVMQKFFVKFKSYGHNLSEYEGHLQAIGLSKEYYPITYDFSSFKPLMLNEYGFKITGIEMFEEFKKREDVVFFNKSLYKSVQPLVTYEANFEMRYQLDSSHSCEVNGDLLGVVEDFFDKPIIYMDYKYLNSIMGYDENHISGFMLNIQNQNVLNSVKKQLENAFNTPQKVFIISTWRELNKKQNDIFKVFTLVGIFLKWIILTLSIVAVTIYLYKALLVKQPQLRLLNILGLRLVVIVNSVFISVATLGAVGGVVFVNMLLPYLYKNFLNQPLDIELGFFLGDIVVAYLILVVALMLTVTTLFKQKYNIFK